MISAVMGVVRNCNQITYSARALQRIAKVNEVKYDVRARNFGLEIAEFQGEVTQ